MKDMVSIIVPIYNAESTIQRCIRALLNQDYSNIEIILVDDGSSDMSFEVCKEYSRKNAIVYSYHIDNAGVSNARNYGIEKANGKWLVFVDVDDELEKNAISVAIGYQQRYNCDTICWNSKYIEQTGTRLMTSFNPKLHIISAEGLSCLLDALYIEPVGEKHFGDYFRASWGKMYLAEIIKKNRLKFPINVKIGEDAIFLIDYFAHCRNVILVNEYLYKYYITETSVTGKYKQNFFELQMEEYCEMCQTLKRNSFDIKNASVAFWHRAEKDFIHNELKRTKNLLEIGKITGSLLKNHTVRKYLRIYDGKGIRSYIRSLLICMKLYLLVGIIDTAIIKKKLQSSEIERI